MAADVAFAVVRQERDHDQAEAEADENYNHDRTSDFLLAGREFCFAGRAAVFSWGDRRKLYFVLGTNGQAGIFLQQAGNGQVFVVSVKNHIF